MWPERATNKNNKSFGGLCILCHDFVLFSSIVLIAGICLEDDNRSMLGFCEGTGCNENKGKTGFQNASFCHFGPCYHVDTRARVIFFDLGAAELDGFFQKRTSSRLSMSIEQPWASSREHEGLMSWPENFYTARNSNVTDAPPTTFSARAMELSIYGTMMNDERRDFRSLYRSLQSRRNQSLSYPSIPAGTTTNVRPLLSVKSEGNNTNMRLGTRDLLRIAPFPLRPARRRRRNVEDDSSDDDSGGEVIVRIDSPSNLSFSNVS